ncbi:MAG: HAMP domain-containing sensor histidine kinase [Methylobacterium sp.]|uniref:sensor histidine kinase n=1 Tax=Methylobacterium sp. TaxID=409 RepID=UPI00271D6335|nr:HAMP domain-containing sensor histidine kinase [Methylobacterium sp.]MDO9427158.1 HAMP domain-containing sensor histidine kinase [Methylobacterium sp.]
MSIRHPRSLKWRLVTRVAATQGLVFALLSLALVGAVGALWMRGLISGGAYELGTIEALSAAVARDAEGRLILRPTPELDRLRSEIEGFWFVVRDNGGHRLTEGSVPAHLEPLLPGLDRIGSANLSHGGGNAVPPAAVVRWVDTAAGEVQMLTSAEGRVLLRHLVGVFVPMLLLTLLVIGLMTLATLLVTPFAVQRALAGLGRAADEAEHIDITRSGARLSVHAVPVEIVPLVRAVNDALARLDRGYEGHKRFLADAAHELRTPIAILTTRISALPSGPEKTRLLEDTTRLTILTGQLLDLQRLDQQQVSFATVDLVALAERAVLDLAPLAFAAGYEMAFEPETERVAVPGDETALERALTNLIQNAIDHGGRRGTIAVRVARAGWIEVCDEGDGIAPNQRDQIFEPFHRLRQGGRGAGLGLDLVQRIMRLHGGHAEVVAGPSSGACVRLVFPREDRAPAHLRPHPQLT